MVVLDIRNSCMTDFYDIWFFARTQSFELVTLTEALTATFAQPAHAIACRVALCAHHGLVDDASKIHSGLASFVDCNSHRKRRHWLRSVRTSHNSSCHCSSRLRASLATRRTLALSPRRDKPGLPDFELPPVARDFGRARWPQRSNRGQPLIKHRAEPARTRVLDAAELMRQAPFSEERNRLVALGNIATVCEPQEQIEDSRCRREDPDRLEVARDRVS